MSLIYYETEYSDYLPFQTERARSAAVAFISVCLVSLPGTGLKSWRIAKQRSLAWVSQS